MIKMKSGLGQCYNCKNNIDSSFWEFCPYCGKRIISEFVNPKKTVKHRASKGKGSIIFVKDKGKYRAKLNGKWLGYFKTEEEAQRAIDIENYKIENPDKLATVRDIFLVGSRKKRNM